MKVTFKDSEITFGTLKKGDTFIDPDYDNEAVIIKVEPCGDVEMAGDAELIDDDFDGYGVDPYTGTVAGYYNSDKVIPVKAEVIIYR